MRAFTEFFGLEHVADVLGVNVATVRRRIADGTLRAIKLGGTWKVHTDELARLRLRALGETFAVDRASTDYPTAEAPLVHTAALGGRRRR